MIDLTGPWKSFGASLPAPGWKPSFSKMPSAGCLPGRCFPPSIRRPSTSRRWTGSPSAEGDDSVELRIVDTVAAGGVPARAVRTGECARIMTGAMLPPGTGRVIRGEYVREEPGSIRVLTPEQGDNVIRRGASLRAGEPVLRPRVIGPTGCGCAGGIGDRPGRRGRASPGSHSLHRAGDPPCRRCPGPGPDLRQQRARSFAPSLPQCAAPAAPGPASKTDQGRSPRP